MGRAKKRGVSGSKKSGGVTMLVVGALGVVGVGATLWYFLRRDAKPYRVIALNVQEPSTSLSPGGESIAEAQLLAFERVDVEDTVQAGLAIKEIVSRYQEGKFVVVVMHQGHVLSALRVDAGKLEEVSAQEAEDDLRQTPQAWSQVA